jgi:CheY-like chemotaxis protein
MQVPTKKKRVASILLADADLASRLTLKSLLSKAGYGVDCAASASEAIGKLDRNEYQLVLTDLRNESGDEGAGLLAYARQKEFHPATAQLSSDLSETLDEHDGDGEIGTESVIRISDDNVSYLLGKVAELIGNRADRRIRLALRQQN